MADNLTDGWREVEAALNDAKSLAWDGCHKIYILLDDEQTEQMRSCGYDQTDRRSRSRLLPIDAVRNPLGLLQEWYGGSCGLRFISSVRTNREDPNAGFTHLITQFAEKEAQS